MLKMQKMRNWYWYFRKRAITSLPLPNDLPDQVKNNILHEREHISLIVKNYTDTH